MVVISSRLIQLFVVNLGKRKKRLSTLIICVNKRFYMSIVKRSLG
jgi:hypothetical protein